jgi:hypothetical protein
LTSRKFASLHSSTAHDVAQQCHSIIGCGATTPQDYPAELAEARRLGGEGSFLSIARMRAEAGYWGVTKIRALVEATYFAGLRMAGIPEE